MKVRTLLGSGGPRNAPRPRGRGRRGAELLEAEQAGPGPFRRDLQVPRNPAESLVVHQVAEGVRAGGCSRPGEADGGGWSSSRWWGGRGPRGPVGPCACGSARRPSGLRVSVGWRADISPTPSGGGKGWRVDAIVRADA